MRATPTFNDVKHDTMRVAHGEVVRGMCPDRHQRTSGRPELPAAFDARSPRCLAKRPEKRYAHAKALEQALAASAA